jgi:hypothetical protein
MTENTNGHNGSGSRTAGIHLSRGRHGVLNSPFAPPGQNGNWFHTPASRREVQFAELLSGGLADLVRGPQGDLQFLVYRDGVGTYQRTVADGTRTLVPPNVDRSLLEAVRWPSFVEANDAPCLLLSEIKDLLKHYLELADLDYDIVAHFALSTWFADLSRVAPYLWVVGAYSCGKTTLLRVLSAICRRPALAADITPAALYSLCTSLRPTLLLDELDSSDTVRYRDLLRLLRNGSTQGPKVFRCGKAYDLFGPKVIVSRQESPDAAVASRALVVAMRPSNKNLPPLDEAALIGIAEPLQARLLAFRLRHYRRKRSSELATNSLTPRMRDIERALTIALLGDAELESTVVGLLRPHDVEAKLKRGGEPEWAVATALLASCHPAANHLTVGQLSFEVEDVLAHQGETYRLTPRKIGDILRSLGIATERLGNRGRGLRLSQNVLRLIHQTAKALGITRADILEPETVEGGYAGSPCDLCEEYGLMVDAEGRKLRYPDSLGRRPSHSLFD